MNNITATVISVLLSGILATLITIFNQKYSSEKEAKRNIFETAVSYRYRIHEELNVRALNSIDVIFHNNRNVRMAWKAYMEEAERTESSLEAINDKYIKLLEEMALACGYKNIKWDDLKKHYLPNGLLTQINDNDLLRQLQIVAARKSVAESVEQQNVPKDKQFNDQLTAQLLGKFIENPDALGKLLEIAEHQVKK